MTWCERLIISFEMLLSRKFRLSRSGKEFLQFAIIQHAGVCIRVGINNAHVPSLLYARFILQCVFLSSQILELDKRMYGFNR